jgi:hypothetical protein
MVFMAIYIREARGWPVVRRASLNTLNDLCFSMAPYSITLNFFIPKEIVRKLKEVHISGRYGFDWRQSDFCHCTVKALSVCEVIPPDIDLWANNAERILSRQHHFRVSIDDLTQFPTAIVALIHSDELVGLHRRLYRVLPSSQPQYENAYYTPHESLVASPGASTVTSPLQQHVGTFEVREIQLMIWDRENFSKSQICRRYVLT